MKRGFRTFIWLVFVVAATLLLFPSQGAAQGTTCNGGGCDTVPVFHLDHFKCYATHSSPPIHRGVGLQDQFDTLDFTGDDPDPLGHEWHQVEYPVQFCNPVGKQVRDEDATIVSTQIKDPDAHLLMYDTAAFELPKKTRFVLFRNQFTNNFDCDGDGVGDCDFAFVSDAHVLAVPTQKSGHDAPDGLDHYKCYPADPFSFPVTPARLWDEFHTEEVSVLYSVLFCNPTRKFHNGVITEIVNADDHLVCYKIISHEESGPAPSHVEYRNQFERRVVPVGDADALCVPSKKIVFFDLLHGGTGSAAAIGAAISGLPAEVQSLLGALQGQ